MKHIYFISGHLDLSEEEFLVYYEPQIKAALKEEATFVVGDARGADFLAQQFLKSRCQDVVVYHMYDAPRNNCGFPTKGGFTSDKERDTAMTIDSTKDIAWVREGRDRSGTAKNLSRRANREEKR